ncbi:hypothetical protein ASZ90_010682 [hydrocarbon metagenome]|uniref:Uncharacterized protein n=1 Tax=hydrocarbon metagenome TaxID=938273 RepID=A0A0W8FFF3_9ZZZZ
MASPIPVLVSGVRPGRSGHAQDIRHMGQNRGHNPGTTLSGIGAMGRGCPPFVRRFRMKILFIPEMKAVSAGIIGCAHGNPGFGVVPMNPHESRATGIQHERG